MTQSSTVLDYAPPATPPRFVRFVHHAGIVLGFAFCLALVGYVVQPDRYVCTGYVILNSPTTPLNVSAVAAAQSQAANGMTSPTNLAVAMASLSSASVPKPLPTAAEVAAHLSVDPVPESKMVRVSYTAPDIQTAAAVTGAVVTTYAASTPGVTFVGPPTATRTGGLFPVAGFAFGLLAGLGFVGWRRR